MSGALQVPRAQNANLTMARPLSVTDEAVVERLIVSAIGRGEAVNKITTPEEVLVYVVPNGSR